MDTIAIRLLGVLVLLLSVSGGSFYFGKHYAEGIAAEHERAEAAASEKALIEATTSVRNTEERWRSMLDTTTASYEKRLKESEDAKNATVMALRNGALSLRGAAQCPSSGNAVPGTSPNPGSATGTTSVGLPEQFSEDVVGRLARADKLADAYRLCYETLRSERAK